MRYPLGFFPTPLEYLPRLSARFPGYRIFIKRDDQTGLAAGGNKTRKLEFLIGDALRQGCDTVVTAGAQQSNHCRQTAAACAKAGLKCHLLLGGHAPTLPDGNLLLSRMLGAQIHYGGKDRKGEQLETLCRQLAEQGAKPYRIPYGGSNHLGAKGFIEAVAELQQQLLPVNLHIDHLVFASSSGGTQAGLLIGKALYDLDSEIWGINIDKSEEIPLEDQIEHIIRQSPASKGLKIEAPRLIRRFDEAGYGVLSPEEQDSMLLMAQEEGILLDPVYTGRAFHGMLQLIREGAFQPGSNLLFWHTGGLPAIFPYRESFYASKL